MSKRKVNWQNRIIGSGLARAGDLLANERNWRIHGKPQQNALSAVLGNVGWVQQIIVNKRSDPSWGSRQGIETVVDGHLRVELALSQSEDTEVPVIYVDLTEEEEALILASFDPIAAMAAADREQLGDLLKSIESGDAEVNRLLEAIARENKIDLRDDMPEPEAQIDKAEELQKKWGTATGQIWEILSKTVKGKAHRLMCGDSTKGEDVGQLMWGEKARLIWTDPPYGVNYGDKLEAANPMGYRVRQIVNDNLSPAELEIFIRSALLQSAHSSVPGAAIYVACPPGTPLPILIASFMGSGFDFHWGLIWLKDQMVLGRGDYHFKHENILYGWKSDAGHYFTQDRKQTSVFEVARPKVSEEHPTMKPPALVSMMIENSSEHNDIIYDPFLGSGTTMVGAEQLGRLCYGMEIEPKYVAVSLQRMTDMGLEPRLADGIPNA